MNAKLCVYCTEPNSRKRSDFCSEKCRQKHNYKPKTSPICLVCGKQSLKLSDYCSTYCYNKHKYTPIQINNECKFCQTIFIKNTKSGFCSSKCRNAFNYWNKINNGLCSCGKKLFENRTTCEDCYEVRKTYKQEGPRPLELQILNSAKARAKKKNLPINIGVEDIIVPEFCPVLGVRLERGIGKAQWNSPSLDRINPKLGYVKGNIMIISHKANTIKQNASTEEIRLVLDYMIKYYKT